MAAVIVLLGAGAAGCGTDGADGALSSGSSSSGGGGGGGGGGGLAGAPGGGDGVGGPAGSDGGAGGEGGAGDGGAPAEQQVTVPVGAGLLRLEACAPNIVRVAFSPTGDTAFFSRSTPATGPRRCEKTAVEVTSTAVETVLSTSALSARVDKATGAVSFTDPSGASITTTVQATTAGDYLFYTYSSGAIRLDVDGQRVIDHWRQGWLPSTDVARVHLDAGQKVTVHLQWTADIDVGIASLLWKPPPASRDISLWSEVGDGIDYTFVYGPELDGVIAGYRTLTGPAALLPKWAFGFWQSCDRYQSQQESLDVLQQYRSRHIPIDVIVQDWQYWPDGTWESHQFDRTRAHRRHPRLRARGLDRPHRTGPGIRRSAGGRSHHVAGLWRRWRHLHAVRGPGDEHRLRARCVLAHPADLGRRGASVDHRGAPGRVGGHAGEAHVPGGARHRWQGGRLLDDGHAHARFHRDVRREGGHRSFVSRWQARSRRFHDRGEGIHNNFDCADSSPATPPGAALAMSHHDARGPTLSLCRAALPRAAIGFFYLRARGRYGDAPILSCRFINEPARLNPLLVARP
ncbi:TIM-barrel domain-containing protein [Sorangium sp. So ce693]